MSPATERRQPTEREVAILKAVTEPGATYEIAADALGISVSTVRGTLRVLYAKLDVRSAGQAIRVIMERVA